MKGCDNALTEPAEGFTVSGAKTNVSRIMVSSLSDPVLRVFRKVIGDPVRMLENLDGRVD